MQPQGRRRRLQRWGGRRAPGRHKTFLCFVSKGRRNCNWRTCRAAPSLLPKGAGRQYQSGARQGTAPMVGVSLLIVTPSSHPAITGVQVPPCPGMLLPATGRLLPPLALQPAPHPSPHPAAPAPIRAPPIASNRSVIGWRVCAAPSGAAGDKAANPVGADPPRALQAAIEPQMDSKSAEEPGPLLGGGGLGGRGL